MSALITNLLSHYLIRLLAVLGTTLQNGSSKNDITSEISLIEDVYFQKFGSDVDRKTARE